MMSWFLYEDLGRNISMPFRPGVVEDVDYALTPLLDTVAIHRIVLRRPNILRGIGTFCDDLEAGASFFSLTWVVIVEGQRP